jgi:hypothetical protein
MTSQDRLALVLTSGEEHSGIHATVRRTGGPRYGLAPVSEDARVVRAVVRLQQIHVETALALALEVGGVLFTEIFDSNPLLLRGRGRKLNSFRKLAAHPDVPYGAATLWRAVGVYELSRRMPHLFTAPRLGISHFRCVIGLAPAVQERLLAAAATEGWSKEQLEGACAAERAQLPGRGRRPLPPLLKSARRLQRAIDLDARSAEVGRLSEESYQEVIGILRATQARCADLEARLAGYRDAARRTGTGGR